MRSCWPWLMVVYPLVAGCVWRGDVGENFNSVRADDGEPIVDAGSTAVVPEEVFVGAVAHEQRSLNHLYFVDDGGGTTPALWRVGSTGSAEPLAIDVDVQGRVRLAVTDTHVATYNAFDAINVYRVTDEVLVLSLPLDVLAPLQRPEAVAFTLTDDAMFWIANDERGQALWQASLAGGDPFERVHFADLPAAAPLAEVTTLMHADSTGRAFLLGVGEDLVWLDVTDGLLRRQNAVLPAQVEVMDEAVVWQRDDDLVSWEPRTDRLVDLALLIRLAVERDPSAEPCVRASQLALGAATIVYRGENGLCALDRRDSTVHVVMSDDLSLSVVYLKPYMTTAGISFVYELQGSPGAVGTNGRLLRLEAQ